MGRGITGITVIIHNVAVGGGAHGEGCIAQRRQVVTLQHLTTVMDSDCNGDLIMGGI